MEPKVSVEWGLNFRLLLLTSAHFQDIFHPASRSLLYLRSSLQIRALLLFAASLTLCCSQLWAQASGAVLKAGGPVLLNGKQVTRSLALLDADKIETISAVASITQPGTWILIGANSTVAYSKDGLTLSSGSATISASAPFSARVDRTTLKPQSAKARFAVRETPCSIQIAALEGAITVNDGTRDVVLDSGKSLSLPLLKPAAKTNITSTSTATGSAVTPNCDQPVVTPQTAGNTLPPPSDTAENVFVWAGTSASSSALVMLLVHDRGVGVGRQTPLSPAGP
jgi:hypothetical protein